MITPQDRARIEAAVVEAEAGSRGHIFCVLAGEVSAYREIPLAWGAGVALLVPPLAVMLGLKPLAQAANGGWTVAQTGAQQMALWGAPGAYAAAQILLFAAVTLLVSIPAARRRLTPRFLKRRRVRKAAFHHFAAAASHAHGGETGVVIFVAPVERQVEILADKAIHDAVGDPVWTAAASAVSDGMKTPDPTAGIIRAIALCGEALKAHFPA